MVHAQNPQINKHRQRTHELDHQTNTTKTIQRRKPRHRIRRIPTKTTRRKKPQFPIKFN